MKKVKYMYGQETSMLILIDLLIGLVISVTCKYKSTWFPGWEYDILLINRVNS